MYELISFIDWLIGFIGNKNYKCNFKTDRWKIIETTHFNFLKET